MAKDAICGMEVEERKAAGTSQYGDDHTSSGRRASRKKSDRNPGQIRQATSKLETSLFPNLKK